ncbi:MAG: hypothetical protein ACLS90_03525 [Clostridia bacterium]
MARNFRTVYNQIMEVAPEQLATKLERNSGFWAPEDLWYNLSEYVNQYVKPSSKDPQSIKIYAILCDCTETEMKSRFEADGI